MRYIQPRSQWQTNKEQVAVGTLGNGINQRRQHDEADIEQMRHANEQRRGADGPRRVLHRTFADERIGDPVRPARAQQNSAKQRAQSDNGAGLGQRGTEALGKTFYGIGRSEAAEQPQTNCSQCQR